MKLVKQVTNYLLDNPAYAIVVSVCCVAIVALIAALYVKSRNAKKRSFAKSPQTEIMPIENEKSPATIQSTPVKTERNLSTTQESVQDEKPSVLSAYEAKASIVETEKKNVTSSTPKPAIHPKAVAKQQTTPEPTVKSEPAPLADPASVPVRASTEQTEQTIEITSKKSKRYNGKWIIWRLLTQNNAGERQNEETYFFELLASNGEKLLSSEEYTSFAGAQKGIQTHKANVLKNNFRVSLTKKGDYIFKLLSGKNTLLCTGENYPTRLRCENAIESTKRFAETAIIDENVHDLIIQLPPDDADDSTVALDNGYVGKWIIFSTVAPDGDQIFYFELFASNGEKLLSSEEYTTYNGVINGINTHKNNIERNNFRISLTKRGDYIFKLLNANDQLLCLGEHYKTRRRCENAVESVKRFAKTAPIMDSPSVKKNSHPQQ